MDIKVKFEASKFVIHVEKVAQLSTFRVTSKYSVTLNLLGSIEFIVPL